ncbi:MAG TPA: hypothetical protein VLL69_08800 [Streptosporangiaceae bacterium]|nr:hypothetical protein [Streptosporangiaceae bacterium]
MADPVTIRWIYPAGSPTMTGLPMSADHRGLTEEDVIAGGGWHRGYARVLAVASDADYGFAVVDGNGDGAELEAETWKWDSGNWVGASSSGAGPLDHLGPLQAGGQIGDAYFAYGRAPGRQEITISFDGHPHPVPVSPHGVWAFIKIRTSAAKDSAHRRLDQ